MHRDIKPDNILLGQDGTLLLNDFDVSCKKADTLARRNLQVGTPAFISPRLESGYQGRYDFRDDWLSLGLSFAQLVGLYPKSGTRQVKLDALQRLQQQPWCPSKHDRRITAGK